MKRIAGIRSRTGDLFAVPLCVGIAIGRIGCFLAGLADDTYGKPTSLPWASTSATASRAIRRSSTKFSFLPSSATFSGVGTRSRIRTALFSEPLWRRILDGDC